MSRSLLGFLARSANRLVRPGAANSRYTIWRSRSCWVTLLALSLSTGGCGSDSSKSGDQSEKKSAEAPVPEELQDVAHTLLGSDAQVLLYGDLAKNGKQEILAANVVPNTPKSTVAGTVVTRAVVAENEDGKWTELMRADEYLKNTNGYLGLTPLQAVTGWKLQFENSADKGMVLYFTPVKAGANEKTLPIAVKWNPTVKRYQSMDLTYEHFLNESPALANQRSMLR
jgi:hypothetical protein